MYIYRYIDIYMYIYICVACVKMRRFVFRLRERKNGLRVNPPLRVQVRVHPKVRVHPHTYDY